MKLGIIGVGKMGYSIISGITHQGLFKTNEIICYELNQDIVNELKNLGYIIANSESEVIEKSEIVILAVKPQNFGELMKKINNIKSYPIIISIAAGISLEYLKSALGENIRFIRSMPNTPLLISKGATAIAITENVGIEDLNRVKQIFASVGIVRVIDESLMHDIIPANGSMPAFAYYFMKAFIDSSIKRGIKYEDAKELVCKSVIGSAEMILSSMKSIDNLIDDVCTPNGVTIEGINVLEDNKFSEIIDNAAVACVKRAKELN